MLNLQTIDYKFQINDKMDVMACFNCRSKHEHEIEYIPTVYYIIKGSVINGRET